MPAPTAPTAPPLKAGQHVIVRTIHIGAIPGTIDVVGDASLTVVLTVRDERFQRLLGHDIAVEVSSGRGIYKHSGTLKADRGGTLTIELTGEVERIQRREFVRISAHLDVRVDGVDEDIGGDTTTLDISGAGIQITDPWNLPLGLAVRVQLKLPEGPPLAASGMVVRQGAEENQKGIRLDGIPRPEEDRLMRYIREREVQMLRAARNR
jgi:PilZ domain